MMNVIALVEAVIWADGTCCVRHWMSLGVPCVAWKQLRRRGCNCTGICYPSRTLCSFVVLYIPVRVVYL